MHDFCRAVQTAEEVTLTTVVVDAISWYLNAVEAGEELPEVTIDFDEPRRVGKRGMERRWDAPISVTLRGTLGQRLKAMADERGESVAQVARVALAKYFTARAIKPARFAPEHLSLEDRPPEEDDSVQLHVEEFSANEYVLSAEP